jgi:serine/threonine protein kinase/Tol biopolymer transport system component
MALTAGTRLGPYEVESALGVGGMGEVYRARDTRLNRNVAIKVLPEAFITDADRLARFKREAQVLASLNHPNIAAIYHVEESDGISALVMELVEGETLADHIVRGPIPIDEALLIARQMAEALEAAHERGVIHRDLKPANVKLRPDGAVKVLDFGLAKALEPSVRMAVDMTASPTIPAHVREHDGGHATQLGVILGTVGYMSPEQARGKAVDKRADIWAFGCVLFEMLTGVSPFKGETLTDTIAAVVKNEPDWTLLSSETPAAIRKLLRRCLTKAPEQRLRDVGDARFELSEVISGTSDQALNESGKGRSRKLWRERAAWLVAAAAISVAAFLALRSPAALSADVIRFLIPPPDKTSFTGGVVLTVGVPQFELSPDGRAIVFVAGAAGSRPMLWLRSFDSGEAQPLRGTEGAEYPTWSPDNRSIAYYVDGELRKISREGETSTRIAVFPDSRKIWWGPDDTILFSRGASGIFRVSASGGNVTQVTELDDSRQEGSHRIPQLLPDGVHFIYQARSSVVEQGGIYAGSLDDGNLKKLLISGKSIASGQPVVARYAGGHLFFLDGDTLMAQVFDTKRLELRGQRFVVQGGVGRSSGSTGAFSLSDSGDLAYAGALVAPSRLTWFDRAGNQSGSIGLPRDYTDFRLSPDDRRLAASVVDPKSGNPDIWLIDDLSQEAQRTAPFTLGRALNAAAVWAPDSSRIVFRTTRNGGLTEFYAKSAGGGGDETPVLSSEILRPLGMQAVLVPSDWSLDGSLLVFSGTSTSDSDDDLWLLPPSGKPVPFVVAPGNQWHANFSPGGDLVAYTSSSESGRFVVRVQTVSRSDKQWTISADAGGYEPRWKRDGGEMYYLSAGNLMAVRVDPGPRFGAPERLFSVNVTGGVSSLRTHYVVSRDGKRFLVSMPEANQAPTAITVVLNAMAKFKK